MATELNRRDFLKGAALGAAGIAAAGSLAACSSGQSASNTNASAESTAASNTGSTQAGSTGGVNTASQKWSFEIAPEPIPDDQIAETVSAEVVVVGAGMSGLVSAASCLENGLDTVLISASKAAVSRGGSNNGVYSSVMQELGLPKQDPKVFYRTQYLANGGNIAPAWWYKYYNNSEEAIQWLIDLAAKANIKCTIESGPVYGPEDPMYAPPAAHAFYMEESELEAQVGTGEPYIANELARYIAEDLKGEIHWETKGEQLIRENNNTGRVSAIIASTSDGKYTKYEASKAIILATGDFSHDKDMMTCYCPECVDLCDFTTEVNYDQGLWMGGLMPGEGQKMGLWIGAAWQKTQSNVMMLGRPNLPAGQPYTSHTGLMVDANGNRFMNEDVLGGTACVTILHLPQKTAYCIWATNWATDAYDGRWVKPNAVYQTYYDTPQDFIASWDNDDAGFGIVKADTVEEVISKLGLPESTIDTVNHYNELCAAGEDTDFYKDASLMVGITEGPFYGCAFTPGFLTSLGGLRTNIDMQVCDADDQPIEGLFNVGSMIGDFYSGTYTFAMEGMNYGATCVTLPYVLGKDIASGKFD